MANPDTPYGLQPTNRNGGEYDGQVNVYFIPATDGTAVAVGDPVTLAGSADADGIPTIKRLTAGSTSASAANIPVGVVVGFAVNPQNLSVPNYRAASTSAYVLVADDPALFFAVQEDSEGGALAATNVGQRINFIMGTPSATTGLSNVEIDSNTAAATADLQAQIIRLLPVPNNVIGTNAKWICKFNAHLYAGSAFGAAGV